MSNTSWPFPTNKVAVSRETFLSLLSTSADALADVRANRLKMFKELQDGDNLIMASPKTKLSYQAEDVNTFSDVLAVYCTGNATRKELLKAWRDLRNKECS